MNPRSTDKIRVTESLDLETGPYVLRTLIANLPLSVEGEDDIHITCVEFLEKNLYIGTSASNVLHYVQIPPDQADPTCSPSYILASRILPTFHKPQTIDRPGVQQILLLPNVSKACVLCNWTVTFYSLPELSPVFGNTQIRPCNWIGGIDLNLDPKKDLLDSKSPSVTVLVSLNKKIRVIKISETPRSLKTIDFSGSVISVRRDSYACVADEQSYALLDVDRLMKIPLFAISSSNDSQSVNTTFLTEEIPATNDGRMQKGTYFIQDTTQSLSITQAQSRGTSFGTFMGIGSFTSSSNNTSLVNNFQKTKEENPGQSTPTTIADLPQSCQAQSNNSTKFSQPCSSEILEQNLSLQETLKSSNFLKPHIVSPTPQEFLLVTGTGQLDPGVGIFVNLEGDPTRSTLEFDKYPHEIVVDGQGLGIDPTPRTVDEEDEGYVLASMTRNDSSYGIEVQRWDLDPGDSKNVKYWLDIPHESQEGNFSTSIGLRSMLDTGEIHFSEVVDKLSLKRFRPLNYSFTTTDNSESQLINVNNSGINESLKKMCVERLQSKIDLNCTRNLDDQRYKEEHQFSQKYGLARSRIVAWSGNKIWWVVRNPLILQFDSVSGYSYPNNKIYNSIYREQLVTLINEIRGRLARNEIEYLSLGYLLQRAGLSFFLNSLDPDGDSTPELERRITEEALLEGGLDPRVVLSTIPYLRNEVDEGKCGIWIHGGIKDIVDNFIFGSASKIAEEMEITMMSEQILRSLKRYLTAWRQKKGFGSIACENELSKSVDAGLLVILLRLDKLTSANLEEAKSVRSELCDVIDQGVDCFDRAVTLLDTENRLYLLSRLYQSRRMSGKVLETWRRILEGEEDIGGDFVEGEQKVYDYLLTIRNISLIQEYGVWLAARNPKLGVQIFAEDHNHVRFDPEKVLKILRQEATGAVKEYLEYLVFRKNQVEYINELINYYLDIVTRKLDESIEAKLILEQSYESYRALRPPKPTYHQFITENSIDEEWWHSRLRLLHLLGSGQDSTSKYDFKAALARIEPYSQELIPELIVLDGRHANHEKALRLLIHGLGDYDTAVNYCLLGGSGIYHPVSGNNMQVNSPTRDQKARLFSTLLSEILHIQDVSSCIELASNLLEDFGGWFDVEYVLNLIPETWSVDLISRFLTRAIGKIVRERNETMIVKALSGVENLKVFTELIDKINESGYSIET
ncbi:Transforming growth factor-beta receptor-associated protein 1-like protein [Golovinomyces cichoracearum]|uniref:Transforming growth factor-beta receptor-associated protein 1-like protein n=1 Tax=Golovinomyces cichoracearum TaxID=62708 RepID=A0A420ITT4_9PEZI|nr:Transforming growth factor-beta receptor-associated protein 1-like protein [Golovinomyces cichoracearum]